MSALAVLTHSLADRRRAVLGAALGLAPIVVWVLAVYPSVQSELTDYIEAMPEAMKAMFGVEDLSTVAGFLHAEMFSLFAPLVFLVLAITAGATTLAGEEQHGALLLVCTTPLSRVRLVLAKAAALVIDLVLVGLATFAAIRLGLVFTGGGIGWAETAAAVGQVTALGVLFAMMALAAGAATGRRGWASGLATSVALVTYLVDALAGVVDWLEPFDRLSPFHWAIGNLPLVHGLSVGGTVLLIGSSAALLALAVHQFDRRDLGV